MNPTKLKTIGMYAGVAVFCFCAATTVTYYWRSTPALVVGPFGAGPQAVSYDIGPLISAVVALLGTIATAWVKRLSQPQQDVAKQVADALAVELQKLRDAMVAPVPAPPAPSNTDLVLAEILAALEELKKKGA